MEIEEFFTKWSEDDPKYYVAAVVFGLVLCWLNLEALDFNIEDDPPDDKRILLCILGEFIVFFGMLTMVWDIAKTMGV